MSYFADSIEEQTHRENEKTDRLFPLAAGDINLNLFEFNTHNYLYLVSVGEK